MSRPIYPEIPLQINRHATARAATTRRKLTPAGPPYDN